MLLSFSACSAAVCAGEITPIEIQLSQLNDSQAVVTLIAAGNTLHLSLSDIEKLPKYQATLKTFWGMSGTFQGVLMRDLIKHYHLRKGTKRLILRGSNGYVAGLSLREFDKSPALLATRINGQPISPEDRGPLILIWPKKEAAALQGTATLSSWVWSISEISTQ